MLIFNISFAHGTLQKEFEETLKNFQAVVALWCEKSDPDLDITADRRLEGMQYLILISFPDTKTVIVSLILTFQHVSLWFGRKVTLCVQNEKFWLCSLPCKW